MKIFLLFLNKKNWCSAHLKRLNETIQMSTHNICFPAEIRKIEIRKTSFIQGCVLMNTLQQLNQ